MKMTRLLLASSAAKETFARIDKAPLPSVGEFADPAAVIRAMRDERDAAYPELLTGAKQGEDA